MECFCVMREEIENRIDPHFYRPEFKLMYKKLSKVKLVSFGEIIKTLINGFDYRDFSEEGLTYLRVSNIKPFEFYLDEVKKISPDFDITKKIKLEKGNLLLTRKGTFGVALSLDKDEDFIICSEIFKIELIDKINPKFVEIILNSNIGQKQFDKYKIGAIMGSLSQEAVKQIKIPLPPLETQNKIVSLMDKAYSSKKSKETESQKLIDSINDYVLDELGINLPQLKDKMIYVVSSEELKNNRIDAYYFQPKFEEVEEAVNKGKFEVKELKEITDFVPGYAFNSNDYLNENGTKLLTIKNIKEDKIDLTNSTLLPNEYYNKYSKFQIRNGDIVIAMTGATIGKSFIFDFDENVLLNQRVGILRPNDKLNKYYLLSFMKSQIFRQKIIRQSCGGAQPNISENEITSIKIPLPPLSVQNKIADEVKKRMQKAETLQKEAKEELEKAKMEVEKIILG